MIDGFKIKLLYKSDLKFEVTNYTNMSTGKSANVGGRYYSLKQGKVTLRVTEDTDGAVAHHKENGDISGYYLEDDWIQGCILKIVFRPPTEDKFKGKYTFFMLDEQGIFSLDMKAGSGYLNNFFAKFMNIDFKKEVKFEPYFFKEKKRTYLGIFQGGDKIEPFFNKDNMGKVPQPEIYEEDGVKKWDFREQKEYLMQLFKKEVFPVLNQTTFDFEDESNSFLNLLKDHTEEELQTGTDILPVKDQKTEIKSAPIIEDEDDLPF